MDILKLTIDEKPSFLFVEKTFKAEITSKATARIRTMILSPGHWRLYERWDPVDAAWVFHFDKFG